MDKNHRKQLIEEYKNTKTRMGVYQIMNTATGKAYVGITQNLKGVMNGNLFKLDTGNFQDRELQQEWKTYGGTSFEQTVIADLDYEKDETKLDYTEDLKVLRDVVTEDYFNKKYI